MIEDADTYAPLFIQAGSDHVTVHQEACRHLDRTLKMIRAEGAKAGVAINPATPVGTLDEVLDLVDLVIVMSVNPGFGGQKFIPGSVEKVKRLARTRKERGLRFAIEIDGGVTKENVSLLADAGVDWLVAGSSVFHSVSPADSFREMSRMARESATVRV
jgi:ribulose-phosphate 3-epimerase